MKEIAERLAKLRDIRHSGYVVHKLHHILVIIMCAILCGLDKLDEIYTFSENRKEYFKNELGIESTPSRATFGRILSLIDGDEVGKVMCEILTEQLGTKGEVVAVDGKAIRSTSKEGSPHSALQILTAYITESRIILGQEAINEKTNEIPVFQQMLKYIDIRDKVVTADAMHCQRATCAEIAEKGGTYIIGLKNNQPKLYNDVALFFENEDTKNDVKTHKTVEKNAERLETRICKKMNDITWLQESHEWPDLQCVFAVERTVICRGRKSQETSFYIANEDAPAEKLLSFVREHWKIESMHWMLDVVFSEDASKFLSENAHKTLNMMRKYALAIHKNFLIKSNDRSSIKSSMLSCLINLDRMKHLLGNL